MLRKEFVYGFALLAGISLITVATLDYTKRTRTELPARVVAASQTVPMLPIDALDAAAKKGDARALGKLGALYLLGKDGTPADPVKAWQYLDRAAAAGNVPATYLLGRALVSGEGLPQNALAGVDLLARAAAAKNDSAMYVLGSTYLSGAGDVVADPVKARTYLDQAVAAGNSYALTRLGRALVKGEGLSKDAPAGVALLERAAAAGNAGAMDMLGEVYLSGAAGVPSDAGKARSYLEAAIAAGHAAAPVRLGRALLKGDTLPQDQKAGRALLERAASDGNIAARRALWDIRKDEIAQSARGAVHLSTYRSLSDAVAAIPVDFRPGILRKVFWVNKNAAVYLVQERLTAVHLYSGPLDGAATPETIQAISDACGHAKAADACDALTAPTLDLIDQNF